MGKDINQGVVDSQLRVHGVQNLRVIDASVIPVIPDCRIQMSVYMIGERVSTCTRLWRLNFQVWSSVGLTPHIQGADFIKAAHPDLYA
jgi:hypothetical protein